MSSSNDIDDSDDTLGMLMAKGVIAVARPQEEDLALPVAGPVAPEKEGNEIESDSRKGNEKEENREDKESGIADGSSEVLRSERFTSSPGAHPVTPSATPISVQQTHPQQAVLVEAREVSNTRDLEEAEPVSQNASSRHRNARQSKWLAVGMVETGSLIILAALATVLLVTRSDSDERLPVEPTTARSTTPEAYLRDILTEHPSLSELYHHTGRPLEQYQLLTLDWMIQDVQLYNYTSDRIIQRFALAALYYATQGSFWIANDNWLSLDRNVSECDWYAAEQFRILG